MELDVIYFLGVEEGAWHVACKVGRVFDLPIYHPFSPKGAPHLQEQRHTAVAIPIPILFFTCSISHAHLLASLASLVN